MGTNAWVLNTITIAAHTMLLTQTGGIAVHLTQPADVSDDALPAIPSHWQPSSLRPGTEQMAGFAELREPRWAPRTLCGIRWTRMAGSDSIGGSTDEDTAPTCRRCLSILDRWFPAPVADDRIGLLAVMIGRAVHEYGTAEVVGVPGDQIAALRRAARGELKQRFGYSAKTYVIDDHVVISSNDTTEALRAEVARQFRQAFSSDDGDTAPIDDSGWRFHWRTWSTPR
jgi:hypothetical protein